MVTGLFQYWRVQRMGTQIKILVRFVVYLMKSLMAALSLVVKVNMLSGVI